MLDGGESVYIRFDQKRNRRFSLYRLLDEMKIKIGKEVALFVSA